MEKRSTLSSGRALRRGLVLGCAIALLVLILPAAILAQSPDPTYLGPNQCASCHPEETSMWQNSTHAKATSAVPPDADRDCLRCHTTAFDASEGTCAYNDVECEACHGAYVEGHPQSATMKLVSDSSACQECHVKTYDQWQTTPHAAMSIDCTACHNSHSQQLRLISDDLCTSCHRSKLESFPHSEHNGLGIECAICHVVAKSQPQVVQASTKGGGGSAPTHDFSPPAEACVGCHGEDTAILTSTGATSDPAQVLADQLAASEKSNTTLRNLAVVSLGLGLGIGGVLGVIVVLLIGYITQKRGQPWTV